MTTVLQAFDSGHHDMVHDNQLDYYGRRIATCSSDGSVKVFDVSGEQPSLIANLEGHRGPVWQIAWAHPKFGCMLASCSFDNTVIIWKESDGGFGQIYQSSPSLHTASVNGLGWAPYEAGAALACASSDGTVSVIEQQQDGTWADTKIPAVDSVGCTSLTWAPAPPPGALVSEKAPGQPVKRFAVGGCDNTIKIYACNNGIWALDRRLMEHTDWVLDVAWAPNLGLPDSTIASSGQDGKVLVWKEKAGGGWDKKLVKDFGAPVWKLSWSITGNLLAAADGTNNVTLWRESSTGQWQQVTQ